ncbi:proteasome subunit beta type-5-like [Teleopsis dalmanni]|uniref:proteasome subunit beta type-5-like n=1 Tax=Teleopsis dalmanni TaxID=139649 RepID=UPI0018CDF336|nr:proteasome subunit beta type-5-like [Teleopsis dalmanni]
MDPHDYLKLDLIADKRINNYSLFTNADLPSLLNHENIHLPNPKAVNPSNSTDRSSGNTVAGIDFDKGSTTVVFLYQGGIIVVAESRITKGSYIVSDNFEKVIHITETIVCTISGCTADGCYWVRRLITACQLYELESETKISVSAASQIMHNLLQPYVIFDLNLAVLIAGYDRTGPSLYYVDTHGVCEKGNMMAVGGGSAFAFATLDTNFFWEMTDNQAYEIGKQCIFQAVSFDIFSGGIIRMYHMTSKGCNRVSETDSDDVVEQFRSLNASD